MADKVGADTTLAILYYSAAFVLHTALPFTITQPFYVFILLFCLCYIILTSLAAVAYSGLLSFDIERAYYLIVIRFYTLFAGSWNTAVCFNRFTAIIWPLKYEQIWTQFMTTIVTFFILAYAMIFQAMFLQNPCWYSTSTMECVEYQVFSTYVVAISVILHALLGLFLIMGALGIARWKGILASQNVETKLILQTLATTTSLMCVGATKFIAMRKFYDGQIELHLITAQIGNIILALYSYVVIGGLFLASTSFREAYVRFFRCDSTCRTRSAKRRISQDRRGSIMVF
uniref:Serpentine receptor class gamma n=1 Tax=Panagrellus redivivus TaxID=6233 RepID=A0A7E4ZU90_PANRE